MVQSEVPTLTSPKFGPKVEETIRPQTTKSRNERGKQATLFQTFNPQVNFEIENQIMATIERIKNERLRK